MSDKNPIIKKVWITKYALTSGVIVAVNVSHCLSISPDGKMIAETSGWRLCYHRPDWHRTEADAIEQVELMMRSKISSLTKSLAKIKAIDPTKLVKEAK
jgi:hypothetical protein